MADMVIYIRVKSSIILKAIETDYQTETLSY